MCECVCAQRLVLLSLTFSHVEDILASHLKHRQISRREPRRSVRLNVGVSNRTRVDFRKKTDESHQNNMTALCSWGRKTFPDMFVLLCIYFIC